MIENDILSDVSNFFAIKVIQAFNYDLRASKALSLISQQLTDDLFNFIEPAFFECKFIVVKSFDDSFILPEAQKINISMNKADLLYKNNDVIIQVFEDKKVLLWENIDYSAIFDQKNTLIYMYENNKEVFIANNQKIDITRNNYGSRFSDEFSELEMQLNNYKLHKIRHSSCPLFKESWFCEKRIFFKGGGKDIPEKYMQESLANFLSDLSIFKGEVGQFEPTREYNFNRDKPIDIVVRWEKSNRIALIEVKWLGKSFSDGRFKSKYSNGRVNEGYKQLKDYYELAKSTYPNKIIKCFLVVIDGRRWNTNEATSSISFKHGMHYVDEGLKVDESKKYYDKYVNFGMPIRMFAEPICS